MAKYDTLRRRGPRREPLPRILIVCEGERTEKGYFQDLKRVERIPVELKIEAGGTPKKLVENAVELKKAAAKEARRLRDDTIRFDEVWCVFDIDEHPLIAEARRQAGEHKINVAISNPCFELWVLLHFQEQTAHVERGKVQHFCRSFLPGYVKEIPFTELHPMYETALKRAIQLDAWQASRQNTGGNPSTGVYKLVQRIKSFRSPAFPTPEQPENFAHRNV